MQEFKNAKINISVARELTDLDEKHQKEALELYQKNGAITLPDVKTLKEKQEVGRQVPGQLTLAEATGQNRPPEDDTVIDVDVQIERFFESLKKATTERILSVIRICPSICSVPYMTEFASATDILTIRVERMEFFLIQTAIRKCCLPGSSWLRH